VRTTKTARCAEHKIRIVDFSKDTFIYACYSSGRGVAEIKHMNMNEWEGTNPRRDKMREDVYNSRQQDSA